MENSNQNIPAGRTPNSSANGGVDGFVGSSTGPLPAVDPAQKISTFALTSPEATYVDESSLENTEPPVVVNSADAAMATGSLINGEKTDTNEKLVKFHRRSNRTAILFATGTVVLALLIAGMGFSFARRATQQNQTVQNQITENNANITGLKVVDDITLGLPGEQQKLFVNGDASFTGNITAANFDGNFRGNFDGTFSGDGSGIQNIKASNCDDCVLLQPNTPGVAQVGNVRIGGSGLFEQLGVGTTNPAYTVDVVGDINASSSLRVGGVVVCTASGCGNTASVTSVNGLTGALVIANSSGAGTTITLNDATTGSKGIAQFNASNFLVSGGTVNTIQDITTASSPSFNGISLTGDLTLGATGVVYSNNLTQTGVGNDIVVDAAADGIIFQANGISFQLPSVGGAAQTICTSGSPCVGGGTAVILAPGAAQTDSSVDVSVFINDTGGGNLLQLQSGGIDRFTVGNTGNTTISGSLTVNTITPTSSFTVGSTSQDFTLQGNASSTITASNGGSTSVVSFATPTANRTVVIPDASGTVAVSASGNIALDASGNITFTGVLPVANGGTNANNAAGARSNLGAAASGANSDITSTTALNTITPSGALTVGATGQAFTLQGTAASVITATNGANTTTIGFVTPTANVTLNFPALSAGTYQLCTTNGNCAGIGGGVTTPGGTAGALARFTGSQIIGDSIISESGTVITVAGDQVIQGSGGLTLGTGAVLGNLVFRDGTSAFSATIQPATLSANRTITIPNAGGTLAVSASGNIALSAAGDITFTGVLPVANGGTNANNAAGARSNLGAAASGANSDITSTTVLNTITPSGALVVGATGQSLTLQGDGSTVVTATSGGNTTTFGFAIPTANVAINLPALSAGSYEVCTTSGNCLGGAGGGANTALSNLASVAINTNLLPGAAGTINLGSNTLPFGTLSLAGTSGTPGTNNFLITGASTGGTRTITLPDASGTVAVSASGNIALSAAGDITFTGVLPVASGGTNANNAAGARSNLGAAASGANSDITSTTALNTITPSGALSVGSTGQNFTLQGTAASVITATDSGNVTTVGFVTPTANVTLNFPALSAGTYQLCTTSGNCAGSGGGVTTPGGTTGALAKFTGSQIIGDSIITESGTVITIAGEAVVQGSGGLTVGTASVLGRALFRDGSSAFAAAIQPATLSADRTITIPNASGTLAVSASGNIALDASGNITFTGVLPVANGGTNANNAAGARSNLGAAASGANSDITSTTALNTITPSGALTVGVVTQAFTMQGTAASVITGTSGGNVTTFGFTTPTANATINLPALSAGSYEVCTTSGNCLGGPGGGANTALSNLASVAINTSLLPGATNIDLGSNAAPFRDLYLGGTGTNNFRFTGTATGVRTLTVPDASGTLAVSASGNIALSAAGDISFTGVLPVASGGTNANNAAGARSNLGAAASGANSDITSTTALNTITPSGALTVGATGQSFTLQGNASSQLTATNAGNTTTVGFVTPTANVTINFPALTAGSYQVCTTSGNCSGSAVTLQSAYDNSTNPEIVVDATRGALTVRDNATPIAANLFEVQSNDGVTTYFGVTASGTSTTGTSTVSGNINTTGGVFQLNGVDINTAGTLTNVAYENQANTFTLGNIFQSDVDFTLGGTENVAVTSDLAGTVNVFSVVGTPSASAGTTRGIFLQQADSANGNGLDTGIYIDNADTDLAIAAAISIQNSGGGGYTTIFDILGTTLSAAEVTVLDGGIDESEVSGVITDVTAGNGLTGGGASGNVTLDIGAGNGITVNANDIAVIYGSSANTAVQGNVTLTCPSGSGNLTGGGDVITLGTGGTCSNLSIVNNPTFTTSVTTPILQNAGLTIAATGANSIIFQTNSLTRLTIDSGGDITAAGDLTVQGGAITAGTTSQAGTLVLHDGSSNTGTLQVAALGQDTVYTLPDPGVGSVNICLSTGNCAGSGSGVTTAGGTTNRVAKFTGSQAIGDSTITDDGTNVSITGDFTLQGGDIVLGTVSVAGVLSTANTSAGSTNSQGLTIRSGNASGATSDSGNVTIDVGTATQTTGLLSLGASNASSITLGNTSAPFTIQGNQTSQIVADNGSFSTVIAFTNPTANVTLNVPALGAGTYDLCTTSGNCVGGGGGGAPNSAQYLVVSLDGTLSDERNLSNGTNITFTDNGANNSFVIATVNNPTFSTSVTTPSLTSSGALTISSTGAGNDIIIDGADILDVQDNAVFAGTITVNGTGTFNSDVDIVLAGTENASFTSDLAGSVNVVSLVATPSASAGTTRGFFVQQADSANANGLDAAVYIDNADTNLAIPVAISIQNSGGGGYTNIFDIGGATISAAEIGLLDGHDAALVDTNDAVNTAITGTGTLTTGALGAGFTTVAVGQGGTGATTFTTNGVLFGNGTGAISVTAAGTNGQCLVATTGSAPSWGSCAGSGSGVTLQAAYDNGNTITTTDGRNISFTLSATATDPNFTITTAANAQGFTHISLADGSNATPPAQLVLVENLDTNEVLAAGIVVQSAAGAITTGFDASDAELTNALSIGSNAIAGTNFSVTGAGAVTAVGVNSGVGLIQGTGGLTLTGATSVNASGAGATNIGNASSTTTILGTVNINNSGTGATALGASGGTLTVTGDNSSTFVLNGVTVSAAEFNLLDGHDAALVDTNDAVNTAITGTGALNAGSITSGFGAIDIGADTITSGLINGQTISSSANFTGTLAVQGASITIGSTTQAGTLVLHEDTNNNTVSIATGTQANGSFTVSFPDALTANDTFCLVTKANCSGSGDAITVNSSGATDANFLNTTATATVSGITWSLNTGPNPDDITLDIAAATGTTAGTLTANAQTIGGIKTFNNNIILAATQTIRLTGDITANRPAGAEGELYFDTTTNNLLQYTGSRWQAFRGEYTIVAANDSTQTEKDAADYVADGTADESEINSALTAAAGGKVLLLAGNYNIAGTINVPDNTTLSGVGKGTIITLNNDTDGVNAIENTNQTTGTGVVLRDFALNGDSAGNLNSHNGISLVNVGTSTTDGATIENLYVYDFDSSGIELDSSEGAVINNVYASANNPGLQIGDGSHNALVSNSKFDNSPTTEGVLINGASYNVKLNSITANDNNTVGVYVLSNLAYNLTITNSTMSGNNIGLDTSADNSVISDNILSSNNIGVDLTGGYNTVSNNSFVDGGDGIDISGSNNSVVGNYFSNTGGAGDNDAIVIPGGNGDGSQISNNIIDDNSCTTTCYAIDIQAVGSTAVTLSGNVLRTGTINDAGTGTIYNGQATGASGDIRFRQANSTTAFLVQNASGGNVLAVDTTNGELEVGNASLAGKVVISDGSSNTITIDTAGQTGDYTVSIPTNLATNDTFCLATKANCAGLATTTLQQAYNNDVDGSDAVIALTSADGAVVLRDAASTIGDLFVIEANGGTDYLTVTATGTTVNGDLSVTAGNFISLAGGNTGSRPGSPTEGMLYFDTDTDSLLTYANGKWQSDRGEYIVVAANDSTQAEKDSADYVADGDGGGAGDGDQVQINAALTAAAGGKVILLAGTYVADATILIPNNTTLAGTGPGTVIELGNLDATDNLIENSDITTGTGIVIRDLKINGRDDLNTAGVQHGIYFNTATRSTIANVTATDWRNMAVFLDDASTYNTLTNLHIDRAGTANDAAVAIEAGSNHNAVSNSKIVGDGGFTSFYALYVDASVSNVISENTISGEYGSKAIHINNGSGLNIIDSNTINGAAITIAIQSQASSTIISNNSIYNNNTVAISIEGGSENLIEGNYIASANQFDSDYAIAVSGNSNRNTVTGNVIYGTSGSTINNAIGITWSNNDRVTNNRIYDDSCTTNCYAITISGGVNNTYLEGNTFDAGSGTPTINDAGTGTIYAGQATAANGQNIRFSQTNSATAFTIQDAAGASLFTADTAARSGSGGNLIKIGNSTGTDTALTILQVDSATADPTTNLSALNGGLFYNSTTHKLSIIENGVVKVVCNQTDASCGGNSTTLQQSYDADADGGDATILLSSTDGSINITNPSSSGSTSAYVLNINQQATGAVGGLDVQSSGTGNLLRIRDNTATAADVLTIADGGATTFKSQTNSTTAFQIQNAAAGNLLTVDTTNAGTITVFGSTSGETGAWQTEADLLPANREENATVIANGYIYSLGGSTTGANGQDDVYYAPLNADGSTGAWSATTLLPANRVGGGAVYVNGYIYYIGGATTESGAAQTTVYYAKVNANGTLGSWQTSTNALGAARGQFGIATYNGYIYVVAGSTAGYSNAVNTVYYAKVNADGSTSAWQTTTAYSDSQVFVKAIAANGYLYGIGGVNSGQAFDDEIYYASINSDGTINSWTNETDKLPDFRAAGVVGVSNGYLYYAGGDDTGWTDADDVFFTKLGNDGSTGAWSTSANLMPANRGFAGGAVSNGYLYSVAGYAGSAYHDDIYYTRLGNTLRVGGNLDLVGIQGGDLQNGDIGYQGSMGGSLTAGNGTFVGTLQVLGDASFSQGVSIGGTLSAGQANFRNATNSTTAFQIQNSAAATLLSVDTTGPGAISLLGNNSAQPGTFSANTALNAGISDAGVITHGGYAYIIGGTESGGDTDEVFYSRIEANGTLGTWTTTTALPEARSSMGAVAYNGYVYVVGGWDGASSNDLYYAKINADGTLGAWQTNAVNAPATTYWHEVIALNGYLFYFGGASELNGAYSAPIRADGSVGSFSAVNSLPDLGGTNYRSENIGVAAANGFVYVTGGEWGCNNPTGAVRYARVNTNGTLGAWTVESDTMPNSLGAHSTVVANGYIYAIGGQTGGASCTNDVNNVYFARLNPDGSTGAWSTATNTFSTPRMRHGAFVNNGRVYVLGGLDGGESDTTPLSSVQSAQLGGVVQVGGSLDLIGLQGGVSSDGGNYSGGSQGGSLTAGNGTFVGTLQVQAAANFAQSVGVGGNLSVQGSIGLNGNLIAQNSATTTTATTSGTGTNTTTLTFTGTTSFANNDVLFIDNAGQDYYTRIVSGGNAASVTVSPAVTFENARTVTKYNIQNIGATTIDYSTNANRFFQGYFLGGVVTGAGSTIYADSNIASTQNFTITAPVVNIKNTSDVANAFQIQNAAATETLISVDTTARGVGGGNLIKIGNSTGTDTATTILQLDGATADPTSNLSALNGGLFYNSTTNKVSIIENGVVKVLCNQTDALCGGNSTTLQQAYTASTGGTTPEVKLDSTRGGIDIQDANTTISGSLLTVRASNGSGLGSALFDINSTGQTTFKNSTDSATAFQIQNTLGSELLTVNTTNAGVISLFADTNGETGAWGTTQNLTAAKLYNEVVTYNGYIYSVGGHDGANGTSNVQYARLNSDGTTDSWANTTSLPTAQYGHTVVVYNGYLYSIGGRSAASTFIQATYYAKINIDGTVGTWNTINHAIAGGNRCAHSSIAANGYLYAIGGANCGTYQNTIFYAKINNDGTHGAWVSTGSSIPYGVDAAATYANGYIYFAGGTHASGGNPAKNEISYAKVNADGTVGAFTEQTDVLPNHVELHTLAVSNGYIYIIGGALNDTDVATDDVYYAKLNNDGSTGTWSTSANAIPDATAGHGTAVANGYVYAVGGINDTPGVVNTVYYARLSSTVQIGANLDLVGLQGGDLAEGGSSYQGSSGGSITAGNIKAVGALEVQGEANFSSALNIGGKLTAGQANFRNTANSSSAFSIQNAAGTNLVNISTATSGQNLIDNPSFELGNTNGWGTRRTASALGVSNSQFLYGGNSLTFTTGTAARNGIDYKVAFKASTQYTLSLWMRRSASTTSTINIGAAHTPYETGTAGTSGSSTTVTGTGTTWTAAMVGSRIWFSTGESRIITARASNTSITVDTAVDLTGGGFGYQITQIADCLTGQTVNTTWTNYICTFTTGSTISSEAGIYIAQTDTITDTIYVDGITLVEGSAALPYSTNATASILQVDSLGAGSVTLFGNPNSNAELGPWRSTTIAAPNPTYNNGVVTVNGYIYSLGGWGYPGGESNVAAYSKINADGTLGAWSSTTPMPRGAGGSRFVAYGNYIYMLAGREGFTNYATAYYSKVNSDGTLGSWVQTSTLPNELFNFTAWVAKGYVYATGGRDDSSDVSDTYYAKINPDGSLGTWGTTTSLGGGSTFRLDTGAVYSNGFAYVTGGYSQSLSAYYKTVFYAAVNDNGTLGTWQTEDDLPVTTSLEGHSMVAANGYIYIIGGEVDNTSDTGAVYYARQNSDGTLGTWTQATNSMTIAISGHGSVVANGRVYVVSGYNSAFANIGGVLKVGGSIDLVSVQGQSLADASGSYTGALGGSITAGNGTFIGTLQVEGSATFNTDALVRGFLQSTQISASTTLTDSDSVQKLAITLGNDANVDTVSALEINATSAATSDADILLGININDLSSANGTVVERGLQIGSGWDHNLFFNDTSTYIGIASGGTFNFTGSTAANPVLGINTGTRSSGTAGNQIKVGDSSGTDTSITLLVLDSAAGDPTTNGGAIVNGSMFYDSTSNRFRCYQNSAWVNCISAAGHTRAITLVPEYEGAVFDGSGTGTLNSSACGNQNDLSLNTGVCAASEHHSYYEWTTSEGSAQSYSIYARYQLPSDFSSFFDDNTIKLFARRSASTASVTYTLYQANGTRCGSVTTVTSSDNTWQQVSLTGTETSCSFSAGDILTFQIDVTAQSSSIARVGELTFSYITSF